jgi:hypothetical protein
LTYVQMNENKFDLMNYRGTNVNENNWCLQILADNWEDKLPEVRNMLRISNWNKYALFNWAPVAERISLLTCNDLPLIGVEMSPYWDIDFYK